MAVVVMRVPHGQQKPETGVEMAAGGDKWALTLLLKSIDHLINLGRALKYVWPSLFSGFGFRSVPGQRGLYLLSDTSPGVDRPSIYGGAAQFCGGGVDRAHAL